MLLHPSTKAKLAYLAHLAIALFALRNGIFLSDFLRSNSKSIEFETKSTQNHLSLRPELELEYMKPVLSSQNQLSKSKSGNLSPEIEGNLLNHVLSSQPTSSLHRA